MFILQKTISRLQNLCDTIPDLLITIPEKDFSYKPSETKWSKKEILGHLIDSAANNHQRFVRIQFEDTPAITYNQDNWNNHSYHNQMDSKHLIKFWELYNRHLVELIKLIPAEMLIRKSKTDDEKNVTLEWLIEDYVRHLEHHLNQIVNYD
ncbi:MAG: DinB family protein [Ignavibacteriales bacterium]|nr:MAG: DinB family protein [Ignavibacteriales bacterium]